VLRVVPPLALVELLGGVGLQNVSSEGVENVHERLEGKLFKVARLERWHRMSSLVEEVTRRQLEGEKGRGGTFAGGQQMSGTTAGGQRRGPWGAIGLRQRGREWCRVWCRGFSGRCGKKGGNVPVPTQKRGVLAQGQSVALVVGHAYEFEQSNQSELAQVGASIGR